MKKPFFISALSVFVQYYDYHLFGLLAASIAKVFLPANSDIAQLLNAYFIIAIAMTAKPAGALILGKIGDVYGRSNSFGISLVGTAIASFIITFCPTYQQIGLISTFIVLFARMCTCAFVSSGTDGVRIYIYEHLSENKQCLGIGVTSVFTQTGSFVAALSAWFFTLDFIPEEGWRVSFLLGAIMGMVIIIMQRKLNIKDDASIVKEAVDFEQFKNLSTLKIIKKHSRLFWLGTIITGVIGSSHQFFIIFFGTYNFEILKNVNPSLMQFYTSLSICSYMIFSLVSGYIADKSNRYHITFIAIICLFALSLGHIYILSNNEVSILLFLLTTAMLAFLTIPAAAILKESTPIVVRYRIFSLSHAIGSIFISAPTAFLSTLLYYKTKITWLPIIYFIVTLIMILLALVSLYKKTYSDENKTPVR